MTYLSIHVSIQVFGSLLNSKEGEEEKTDSNSEQTGEPSSMANVLFNVRTKALKTWTCCNEVSYLMDWS